MSELDGRVAVVSGAARGQGRAIARRLAAAGARIVAGDVRTDELAMLGDELGEMVLTMELDIREPAAWKAVLARAVDRLGRIDVLVNNAGVLRQVPLCDETPDGFEAVWRVNCLGAFHGIQAVAPHLRVAGGGAIVNTLSTAALMGWSNHAAYASSKWALRGLTKVAALELASEGIRVNAVVPGPIATPMVLGNGDPDAARRLARTPLGRIGEAEDVAEAVLYLVSEGARFVTGAELTVDGGLTSGVLTGRLKA
jgi:NAD(P)-dependent dehydrogenase (short-subunit alcohol dehydrogenase family)